MKHPVESRIRRSQRRPVAWILILWMAFASSAQAEDESLASEGGVGATAAIATLVYAPLKLVYAAGGLVLSSLTWLWTWGDTDAAGSVARASVEGDYVVTPSHLRRESDLVFHGDS